MQCNEKSYQKEIFFLTYENAGSNVGGSGLVTAILNMIEANFKTKFKFSDNCIHLRSTIILRKINKLLNYHIFKGFKTLNEKF